MRYTLIAMAMAAGLPALGQGTVDDYNRAYETTKRYSADKVLHQAIRPQWIGESHQLWYLTRDENGAKVVAVDADKKKKLREIRIEDPQLEADLGKDRLLGVSADADTLRLIHDGWEWAYLPSKKKAIKGDKVNAEAPGPERHWMEVDEERSMGDFNGIARWDGSHSTSHHPRQATEDTSPDGTMSAYVKNSNVWVRNLSTGEEKQLTYDGNLGNYYSRSLAWSPDGKKLAATRILPAQKRYVYYVESTPESQLQPVLHQQEYAKPGDELMQRRPCIIDVESGEMVLPQADLIANQFELYGPEWDKNSQSVTFEMNERGHKHYRLIELNTNGNTNVLIEESDPKYVFYPRIFREHLEDGNRIIWSSERDGYHHMYMYDRAAHSLSQITKGEWYVRDIQHIDQENDVIYFSANGIDKDEDPYNVKFYSVNMDGSNLRCLTPETGMHQVQYSYDMAYLIDTYSSPSQAHVTQLRKVSDGSLTMTLEQADLSQLLAEGWTAPEVFAAPGRDGKTDMWGVIMRPSNFDPNKKYPVVEYIYQGPGDHYVSKSFLPCNRYMTPLAELGFIVVMVDGMGTSYRSKEFEQVCYQNLQDAGLPDHIAWIKAAAEKYPYMDTERVGIYGCSAGGQESTAAVLFHPEFYKCAYSACGCHDNRMDKIWWNELWMGYPVTEAYSRASNVDNAHLLTRPLMLVVGELDDNVDPASTMQLAAALIKAGKDFELVVIPGARHTVGEEFGEHKRYDFFTRHLLGVRPPSWNEF